MFASFSLPDLAAVSRRTMLASLVVGVVGLVAAAALGAPLVGVGLCLGIGTGIVNFRLIQRSVVKVGERQDENRRRPLAVNTLGRLTVITVVAIALGIVELPLGDGKLAGGALFQAMLLVSVARSMFKMGHAGSDAFDAAVSGDDPRPAVPPAAERDGQQEIV